MISILLCDENDRERAALKKDCRERVAKASDERLKFGEGDLAQALEQEKLGNLLYCTFHRGQSVEPLREFRSRSLDAMVMLIADPAVSPLEYLRPGVAPDGLMLRPLDRQKLEEGNQEFMDTFFERLRSGSTRDSFLVDCRGEKIFLPYASIVCFEAREKKLFACTREKEFPFDGTIDALETTLPENFARCHRSYIVNRDRVKRMITADSCLDLGGGRTVPVSRTYKAAFRGGKT